MAGCLILAGCVTSQPDTAAGTNPEAEAVPVMNVTPLQVVAQGGVECVVPRLAADRIVVDQIRDQQAELHGTRLLEAEIPEPYDPLELEPTSDVSIIGDDGELPDDAAPLPPVSLTEADAPLAMEAVLPAPATAFVRDLSSAEATDAYNCVASAIYERFGKSPHVLVRDFPNWAQVSVEPFFSEDLGSRYVTIFANNRATGVEDSNLFTDRSLPVGAVLAAPSFSVSPEGVVTPGPLTLIEKKERGFTKAFGNWRFTVVNLDGSTEAATRGRNASSIDLCKGCTAPHADELYLTLLHGGELPQDTEIPGAGQARVSVDPSILDQEGGVLIPGVQDDGAVLDPGGAGFGDGDESTLLDPSAPLASDGVLDPGAISDDLPLVPEIDLDRKPLLVDPDAPFDLN